MKNSLFFNESGFSLLEIALSAGLLGIITMAIIGGQKYLFRASATNRTAMMMDSLFVSLEKNVFNAANLQASIPLNAAGTLYNKCLTDPANANDCILPNNAAADAIQASDGSWGSSFKVYNGNGTQLAGPVSDPIRYNANGTTCAAMSADCPFEAVAFFVPQCVANAANCKVAQNLLMGFRLKVADGVANLPTSMVRMKTRMTNTLYPISSAQIISGGGIGGAGAGATCAAGQYLIGINADGSLNCANFPNCNVNQRINIVGGVITCKNFPTCANNQVYQGVDANDNPICRTRKQIYRCIWVYPGGQDTFQSQDPNCEGRNLVGHLYDGITP